MEEELLDIIFISMIAIGVWVLVSLYYINRSGKTKK